MLTLIREFLSSDSHHLQLKVSQVILIVNQLVFYQQGI